MSADTIFLICNYGVLPAWLLLVVLPRHKITQLVVHAVWIPCLLAIAYIWAFATGPTAAEGAGFASLQGVMLLFQSPMAVLAGWVHYLAFDLFVGAWQVRDAKRQGIHHGLVIPCLVATLMLGPIGLMMYALLRLALKRVTTLNEQPEVSSA
jgi:hypothetical protein